MVRTLILAAVVATVALFGSGSAPALSDGPVSPASPAPPVLVTTLSADADAGATSFDVVDLTIFDAGDKGVINPRSTTEEFFIVDSFGSINPESPLQFDHTATEVVVNLTRLLRQIKGDLNCDGAIDTSDLLTGLSNIGGIPDGRTNLCPEFGAASAFIFGDLDCDGDVDTADDLYLLLFLSAASASLPPGCAPFGPADPSPSADLEVLDIATPSGFPVPDVEMAPDTPTVVAIQTTINNLGPAIAPLAQDTFTYAAPASCTIQPNFTQPLPPYPAPLTLLGPKPQTATDTFTVQCSEPGLHVFDVCIEVQPIGPPGVTDPAPGNNESCYGIGAFVPAGDIEVIAVELEGLPDELPIGFVTSGQVTWFTKNNGPTFVDAEVALSVAIGNAPAFWYRLAAEVGDRCFFNNAVTLIAVPCAEGHADPSQPTDVADNCFDGLDNDGDLLIDFAGGDPDCIGAISDLNFDIELPADGPGIQSDRLIDVRCVALGPFSMTFGNTESPIPPAVDPDLTNNDGSGTFGFDCVIPPS